MACLTCYHLLVFCSDRTEITALFRSKSAVWKGANHCPKVVSGNKANRVSGSSEVQAQPCKSYHGRTEKEGRKVPNAYLQLFPSRGILYCFFLWLEFFHLYWFHTEQALLGGKYSRKRTHPRRLAQKAHMLGVLCHFPPFPI